MKGLITGLFTLKTRHHNASKQQVVSQCKGLSPFSFLRQRAQTECKSKPAIMWPQPPRRWLGEDIIVYNIYGSK